MNKKFKLCVFLGMVKIVSKQRLEDDTMVIEWRIRWWNPLIIIMAMVVMCMDIAKSLWGWLKDSWEYMVDSWYEIKATLYKCERYEFKIKK